MDFLFTELLNSGGHGGGDRLDNPKWVEKFISGFNLESLPSRQDIDALKELRRAMRNIVEASGAGKDSPANDIDVLRRALGGAVFRYGLDSKDPGIERDGGKVRIDGDSVFISGGGRGGGTVRIDGDSVFISGGGHGGTVRVDGDSVTISDTDAPSAARRSYSISAVPEKKDFSWVLHEVAMSFAEVLISDSLNRVKICGNPDCRWVFFDESKNASRKWCSDTCGSLIKMREFRKRKAEKKDRE